MLSLGKHGSKHSNNVCVCPGELPGHAIVIVWFYPHACLHAVGHEKGFFQQLFFFWRDMDFCPQIEPFAALAALNPSSTLVKPGVECTDPNSQFHCSFTSFAVIGQFFLSFLMKDPRAFQRYGQVCAHL